jgi:predicted amidohydrolase YtcJ
MARTADLVLRNGRISTWDPARAEAAALAMSAGRTIRRGR